VDLHQVRGGVFLRGEKNGRGVVQNNGGNYKGGRGENKEAWMEISISGINAYKGCRSRDNNNGRGGGDLN